VRNGKRYRYYVTQSQPGGPTRPWRLPAHEVEALVTTELAAFLTNQNRLCGALDGWSPSPDALQRAFQAAEIIAEQLRGTSAQRRQALVELVSRIRLTASGLDIEFRASASSALLRTTPPPQPTSSSTCRPLSSDARA
jgi:hypothetical protein